MCHHNGAGVRVGLRIEPRKGNYVGWDIIAMGTPVGSYKASSSQEGNNSLYGLSGCGRGYIGLMPLPLLLI